LRGQQVKNFRRVSGQLRNSDFEVQLYKQVLVKIKGKNRKRFIRIATEDFIPKKFYRIYIRHIPTKQRRILAVGNLKELPIRSKNIQKFGKQLAGRTFNPKYKAVNKAKGLWIPTHRVVNEFLKELRELGRDLDTEVRGAIIPTRRYFHTKWHVFSDVILKGDTKVKNFLVNIVIQLGYAQENWIGKHNIKLEFTRGRKIKDLHKLETKLEKRINNDLQMYHPKAEEISMIEINGFVPII